jgi:hypothetical protein
MARLGLVRGSSDAARIPLKVLSAARRSFDADHTVGNLKERFDQILATLESVAGWRTARIQRPVQIPGSLDGIQTGVRQLIRAAPLEVEHVPTVSGTVTVPTRQEMLRIKAWLILTRNATRDYVDFVALAANLGTDAAALALSRMDDLYPQQDGESAIQQLMKQLAQPTPFDLEKTSLSEYRELNAQWHDWNAIVSELRKVSVALMDRELA